MNPFFADRIVSCESDFAILRGVIAEAENRRAEDINVNIVKNMPKQSNSLSDELEKMIK